MDLFFRKYGSGRPVIILHGLYGSGDNWYSIAREISVSFTVYLIDQRNHGNSPHHPVHDYKNLSADLNEFIQKYGLNKVILIGHSMGGKTALAFGLDHPEIIEKLVVIDISPFGYEEHAESDESRMHRQIIKALKDLDIKNLSSREEADRILSTSISSFMVRQFLLKSLKRKQDGRFHWALNLEALDRNMSAIFETVINGDTTDPRSIPEFPLIFIRGEKSGYINGNDIQNIHHYFPKAEIVTIPDSGHWVHAEQPRAFLDVLMNFIKT